MKGTDMPNYLHVGGANDGLTILVVDDAESAAGFDLYIRDSLNVGDVSITIYRHESLTPEEVLNRLVEHYHARARPSPSVPPRTARTAPRQTEDC
jgi:hypothetical protein